MNILSTSCNFGHIAGCVKRVSVQFFLPICSSYEVTRFISSDHCALCSSNMHTKRRLKYNGAIGKHAFVVKIKYPMETINLTAYLGFLLRITGCGVLRAVSVVLC